MRKTKPTLTLLGQSRAKAKARRADTLEVFSRPKNVDLVKTRTSEFTSVCPVTGQPDYYTVEVTYAPREYCVESKSLKLYLGTYRNNGHFCEKLAELIGADLFNALKPHMLAVTVIQVPRGGISIEATANFTDGGEA